MTNYALVALVLNSSSYLENQNLMLHLIKLNFYQINKNNITLSLTQEVDLGFIVKK